MVETTDFALDVGDVIHEVRIQEMSHDNILVSIFSAASRDPMSPMQSQLFRVRRRHDSLPFTEIRKHLASLKGLEVLAVDEGETKVTFHLEGNKLISVDGLKK